MENTLVAKKIQYLPELDSLRTLAVIMTLLAHFSPIEIPYMWYGVPIFFTISGFLITTILLNSLNNDVGASKIRIIKNFMMRRVFRLFPIYYLFLVFFWFAKKYFSLYLWKDEFTPYFFTYTPNILIYKIGASNAGCFAHLWSLGVEEQFYLFWPWLILFSPKKIRMSVIISMIAISLIYIFFNYTDANIGGLTFTNFHTLGVGAILACLYVKQDAAINWLKEKRHLLFGATFVHLIIVLIFFKQDSSWWHLYREISLCLCTFSIVLVSIYGWKGIVGYISRNKQIQYIGTISYGIYLFHMPVPYVYRTVAAKLFPAVHLSDGLFLLVCFVITFILAALSYKYIETPFLRLKSRFA
jgi:peptidoglycan/LPS O-acetylase OafA/YrhL